MLTTTQIGTRLINSGWVLNKVVRGVLAGLVATLMALGLWGAGVTDPWEAKTWDWRVRLMAGPGKATNEISLILLDQQSLDWAQEVNALTWPWPREIYGAIVDFCKRNGARAIAFDVMFTEDSKYGVGDDEAFAGAMNAFNRVVLPVFLSDKDGKTFRWPDMLADPLSRATVQEGRAENRKGKIKSRSRATLPVDVLAQAAAGFGFVGLRPDPDGIYRRVELLHRFDGKIVPSFGLSLHLAGHPETVLAFGLHSLRIGEKKIPVDESGSVLLRYRGASGVHPTFSAAAVLQSEIQFRNGEKPNIDDPEAFAGKFVLFGFSAPGLYDLRPSPTSGVYPGVEVHATFLDNLLSGDFIRPTPYWFIGSFVLITTLFCSVLLAWVKEISGNLFVFFFFLAIPILFSLAAYSSGYYFPLLTPEISIVLATGIVLLVNYSVEGKQKRFIKSAFRHFLSPAVIDQIIKDPDRLTLGGERRMLSIFFSDLQGFTSISEKMSPESLIQLLNDYLTEMTNIVHEEGGTIDKYEGDAIIAFWNAPLEEPDHAFRAVRAALRCQQRLARLRPVYRQRTGAELHMRIGINTGTAVVGNLGSDTRFDYTMIGDAVNLAARLEGANKQFGTYTMISQFTYDQVKKTIRAREMARLTVVGRKEPVTVYEPMTDDVYDQRKRTLQQFHLGLDSFYKGDFACGEKIFSEIEDVDPCARSYAKKCRLLISMEQSNWKGVWAMNTK